MVAPVPLPPPLNLRPLAPPASPPRQPQPKTAKATKRLFDVASLLGNVKSGEEEDGEEESGEGEAIAEKRMRHLEQITAARGLFRPPLEDDTDKPSAESDDDDEGKENSKSDNEDGAEDATMTGGNGDKENNDSDSAGEDREREMSGPIVATPSFPWPLPASAANGAHATTAPPPLTLPGPPPPLASNGLPPAHEYLARYYQLMQQNQQRMHGAIADGASANAGEEEEDK